MIPNANPATRPSDEALNVAKSDVEQAPQCDNTVLPPKPADAMPPPSVAHEKENPSQPPTRASLKPA